MLVQPILDKTSYTGQVVVLGKISSTQNHLFNLHKANLIQMIKDKPYDLFVKQSKSGKTITLMTEKNSKSGYFVRKNKQNFEECAGYAIEAKDRNLLLEKQKQEKEMRERAEMLFDMHQTLMNNRLFLGF